MTTNVPQDVIDDIDAAYKQVCGEAVKGLAPHVYEIGHAFSQLRAKRAGGEAVDIPVESIGKVLAEVMELAVANGANSVSMPDHYVEIAGWLSGIKPDTQPQPALDFAAGMMKAAEIVAKHETDWDLAHEEILSAIPKESADALKDYVRGKCMEVAREVRETQIVELMTSNDRIKHIVNRAVEGKS
jgi:hypothetical protein